MNKTELISAISDKSGLTKADCERSYQAFVETIKEQLGKNESVTLIGFGTFLIRHRKARVGRNPRTGEEIPIEASNVPAFKAGKGLKDAVN